jgi:hypothetical protein
MMTAFTHPAGNLTRVSQHKGMIRNVLGHNRFFRPKEIKEALDSLKLSSRAKRRWERLLEVYGHID